MTTGIIYLYPGFSEIKEKEKQVSFECKNDLCLQKMLNKESIMYKTPILQNSHALQNWKENSIQDNPKCLV